MLTIDPHPLLDLRSFVSQFPSPLGETTSSAGLLELLSLDVDAPLATNDEVKGAVRDLFRHGGFKPTGRSKPASEYLLKAAGGKSLSSINTAVDVCNVVSLHSGLPISVVDLERVDPPLRVGVAPADSEYIFNASGQTISLDGLLCLFDRQGPCANGVKDSQRTKTSPETRRVLWLIWGTTALEGRSAATADWCRRLLQREGATLDPAWRGGD